ncbi:MAG: glycosyltransferase family 39 protein [Nitrospiraceae bacterium]|nr:glycosyltransferase family 39 protein [Nitrospiraceae bacterium]
MTTEESPTRPALILLVLLMLSGLLFFLGLGSMGLTDRDEGRNAEAGREMYASGDLLTPTFNEELRVAKPVFLYWLMTASYHLFGVNEFAARFPSALFGVGLILMQYLFLSRLRGHAVALFASLMLLLNVEMLALGRMALTDSVLIFFTTSSLYGFWLGLHGAGRTRHWMWWFYAGMALATLTKGPVGVAVPLVTVMLYLTASRRWTAYWQQGFPIAGLLLLLALALPWYAAMLVVHGDAYTTQAKVHTVGRFLSPMEGHGGTVWFYLPVVLLGFFPWSGLLPAALYRAFRSWRETRHIAKRVEANGSADLPRITDPASRPDDHLEWFAALWVVGVFLFFTLSSTRLPHYIGPLFPAAAMLTALYWSDGLKNPLTTGLRGSIHGMMALGYLVALAFASVPTLYEKFSGKMLREFPLATQFDLGSGPYLAAAVILIGTVLVGYFGLNDERRGAAFWAAGGMLAGLILIVIVTVIPGLNRYAIAPPQELAYAAGQNLGPKDQLIAYGSTRPSTVFYARRKTVFIPSGEEERLRATLMHPGKTMILLPETMRDRLPVEAKAFQPILKRHGYLLLASQPMVTIPEGVVPPADHQAPRIFGH